MPSTRETEILVLYAQGVRTFTELDLDDRHYDFSGATLVEADFSRTFVTACFRDANLERAVFKSANVKTCDFTNANLTGASFEGAAIDAAVFTGANLLGASFLEASEQGHVYSAGELPARDAA